MATCSDLLISEATSRRLRLLALLIDGGTTVLRHVFDQSIRPNTDLDTYLNRPDIRADINKLVEKKVIPRSKFNLLYPLVGKPDSTDLDVTILVALLRNICGLDPANSPVWDKYPPSHDESTAADITRIRCQRNTISHLSELKMTEQEFEDGWSEMEQALLRLGTSLPNLPGQIQSMKIKSIDPKKEKEYEAIIADWDESDKLFRHHMQQTTRDVSKLKIKADAADKKFEDQNLKLQSEITERKEQVYSLEHDIANSLRKTDSRLIKVEDESTNTSALLKLIKELTKESPKLKQLKETTRIFFEDTVDDEYYVKTKAYQSGKEKLCQTGCLIISGHAGEGKSTMALKLIQEVYGQERCLKMRQPSDWELVDICQFGVIFIDDIFGACTKSESLLHTWEAYFEGIWKLVQKKRISVVITSRSYILEEARTDLSHIAILQKEHTVTLSSKDLTVEEKMEILQKGLEEKSKQLNEEQIEECVDLTTDFFIGSIRVEGQGSFMFGFPECVHMFVSNDELFSFGPDFFRAPLDFFVKCVKSLKRDEKRFLALAILWFFNGHCIRKSELDLSNISHLTKKLVEKLGFKLKGKLIKVLRSSLENHVGGLLNYNEQDGSYTFSHAIIGETVGLVVGQEYPELTIEKAAIDFLMEYLTTDSKHRDDFHVYVEEHLFQKLTLRFQKEMFSKMSFCLHILTLKRGGHCGNTLLPHFKFDASICSHDAFENVTFVKMFLKQVSSNQDHREILCSNPVVDMSGFFLSHGIVLEKVSIYLPSYSLIYNSGILLQEMWRSKVLSDYREEDISIALLFACHYEREHAVSFLLDRGAKNIDDALYIATAKENSKIIKMLSERRSEKDITKSHIVNGNTPLIIAAKRGLVKSLNCLIDNGADMMFRNKDGDTALDKAVKYNQPQSCQCLIDHGVPFEKRMGKFKRTALHVAADLGHEDVLACLLQNGAKTRIKDHRGHYPIHCAAIRGHVSSVKLLLEHDPESANLKITSYGKLSFIKGMSLYHIAVWKENTALINVLLEKGVNVNVRDIYGRTPLYCAAYDGKMDVAKLLLPSADVDLPDKNGYTPLHASLHRRHTEVSELLCPHANINIQDRYGRTPFCVACEVEDLVVVNKMMSHPKWKLDWSMYTSKSLCEVFRNWLLDRSARNPEIGRLARYCSRVESCVELVKLTFPDQPVNEIVYNREEH